MEEQYREHKAGYYKGNRLCNYCKAVLKNRSLIIVYTGEMYCSELCMDTERSEQDAGEIE